MPSRAERGFALPLTIFVITIVTTMLAAVFVRTQADRRIAESSADQVAALMVAQSGLEMFLSTWSDSTHRPEDGDSVRLNINGPSGAPIGWADVVAYVVRKPLDTLANWMYVVRSTGHVVKPSMGADPQAVRTVAQFAQWQTGAIKVPAAFTAAHRLTDYNGSSRGTVDISGHDSPTCGSVGPSVPGLRGPGNSRVNDLSGITGSPPPGYELGGQAVDIADSTQVDWFATVNGGFLADYDSFMPSDDTYPTQLVVGDAEIKNTQFGYGLLIVTGSLKFSGWFNYFYGIILVGDEVNFSAGIPWSGGLGTYIRGSVVSGLNRQLGQNPPATELGKRNTGLHIQYDTCQIKKALAALTGFMPVSNAWVDNWASY